MLLIDPDAIAAFSNGDLVDNSTTANWKIHDDSIALAGFLAAATSFGPQTRYLATLGNHDLGFPTPLADWLTPWNQHLPGQLPPTNADAGQPDTGHNGTDGVYYAVTYANTLFIMLDSEHVSTNQTNWLKTLLSGADAQSAQVKLAFFHEPVYPCTNFHGPRADELPWVDLFEKNGVRLAFVSHLHTYERTCRMIRGTCKTDGTGVTYQQLGPLGASDFRAEDRTGTTNVTGTDSTGAARTDSYSCTGTNGIILKSNVNVNTFSHVRVSGCRVIGDSYVVTTGGTNPFDSWEVNGCE